MSGTNWFRKQPNAPKGKERDTSSTAETSRIPTKSFLSMKTGDPPAPPVWQQASTPTKLPSKLEAISGKVVMQHFARSEVRNLDKTVDNIHSKLFALLAVRPEFKDKPPHLIMNFINKLTFKLQQCNLTINFSGRSWFAKENLTTTYTQMYERGLVKVTYADGTTEKKVQGNAMNSPLQRVNADNKVSFGSNIDDASMQGVKRFMHTGTAKDGGKGGVTLGNTQFNAKAKQLFAGLDWRNVGGAAPDYGRSYLVLNDNFKQNAIYYMGDTFIPGQDYTKRVTYGMLAAVLLNADASTTTDLVNFGMMGQSQSQGSGGHSLIEAHIYDTVSFTGGAKELHFVKSDLGSVILEDTTNTAPDALRAPYYANVKKFCDKHGIKLIETDF